MHADKAISILAASNDGDKLQSKDLRLVELAVNGQLNDAGVQAFGQLYASVTDGSYFTKNYWLHGIENLTRDGQGYVYWKGKQVEHFSYAEENAAAEEAYAHRLAAQCLQLEANGFSVNSRTAINADCYAAPVGTPWVTALKRYYAFFRKDEQVVGIFYRLNVKHGEPEAVAAYKDAQGIHLSLYPGAYEAYHATVSRGFVSAGIPVGYEETTALLAQTGLSGSELDKIINATT